MIIEGLESFGDGVQLMMQWMSPIVGDNSLFMVHSSSLFWGIWP